MTLRGQDSALILALLRVLCVSRDRSKRFLEDLEPQSRSAVGGPDGLVWSKLNSDFGSP